MNSVRTRLTLLNVGVLTLVLLLLGIVVFFMARQSLIKSVDAVLTERAQRFLNPPPGPGFVFDRGPGVGGFGQGQTQGQIQGNGGEIRGLRGDGLGPGGPGPGGPGGPGGQGGRPGGGGPGGGGGPEGPEGPPVPSRIRILNRNGRAIQPWQQAGEGPYDQAAFDKVTKEESLLTTATVNDESRRVYTALIPPNKPGMPAGGYVVQFSEPLGPTNRAVGVLTSALLTMVPIAVLLATLGGLYLTGRALRPVGEMQQSAERISGDNLSGRLTVLGNDEFAQLGGTINRMLSRLQEAFSRLEKTLEQQKRFTADASHELKTPLTVIKSNTGLALSQDRSPEEYRRTLETVDKAASSMGLLVTDLLLLAKADAGGLLQRQEPFPLDRAIHEAIDLVQAAGGPPVAYDGAPGATLVGNPEGIRRVFVNLLTNAAQHTPDEGSISVEVCRSKDSVAIRVKDTGSGIAPEHLPHLTERFYRVDQSRTGRGSGLGLAICQEIVSSHGGSLRVESQVGAGTVVTVTLPMQEGPAAKSAGTSKAQIGS